MKKTAKRCSSISRLLYLYRGGELSPKEKSLVDNHTRICSECTSLLKKLQSDNSYLEPYRSASVSLADPENVINATIQQIANHKQQSTKYKLQSTKYQIPSTPFTAWLRPALIGSIAVILCFLCFQQLRDAIRSSALEHRLKERTPAYAVNQPTDGRETDLLLRRWRGRDSRDGFLSLPQSRAETGKDLYEKVLLLWREIFGKKNGFIDHLQKQYPGLLTITVDDGLSMEERTILATEGKALIKELEQLNQEGEKQQ